MKKLFIISIALFAMTLTQAFGANSYTSSSKGDLVIENSLVGVLGYDLVSYHTGKKPLPGNGNFVAVHDGIKYLFTSKANKETFESNPHKYVPAFGGYCAFGVAVGKKFIGDPTVWKLVDGKLYLNLDTSIQALWNKDVKGNIKKANKNWSNIAGTPASKL